jgi:hypothetical protein
MVRLQARALWKLPIGTTRPAYAPPIRSLSISADRFGKLHFRPVLSSNLAIRDLRIGPRASVHSFGRTVPVLQPRVAFSSTPSPSPDEKMADRDILPDHFKPGHYDLTISNLDFPAWEYKGKVM